MATISKQDLLVICKQIAPNYQFDPLLILALCEQESAKDPKNPDIFLGNVARLEEGFYTHYEEANPLATTTAILLSASFGVTQMMGQSLLERGYFKDDFESQSTSYHVRYMDWMNPENIVVSLNRYCINFKDQINYSCKHLDVKRRLANGDIARMLDLWNGDVSTMIYSKQVLDKYNILKGGTPNV